MENKKSFEQLLQELEQIVKELEAKDIQLEMAIKKYQEGIELAKLSYKMLEDANALIMKKAEEILKKEIMRRVYTLWILKNIFSYIIFLRITIFFLSFY